MLLCNTRPLALAPCTSLFVPLRLGLVQELGKYREAMADCSIAIDLNTKYVRAYVRRARIRVAIGTVVCSIGYPNNICVVPRIAQHMIGRIAVCPLRLPIALVLVV